ncbi:MAG: DUF5666 domain-containing protein [Nitrospira sp.]
MATVASGPVTKFGSVFVSGTEYDNSQTLYCIDEEPCTNTNTLKLGMIVLVNGTASETYGTNQVGGRTAEKISYEETVEGEVQTVAADGLSFGVLGQVVHIDQRTQFDAGVTIGPSLVGSVVEVSGFVVGDGHILATFIGLQTGTPHYEIQGPIKNHDVAKRQFLIGTLVVEYPATADITQMPPLSSSHPTWDGLLVHVRGNQWNPGGSGSSGTRLTADRIKPQTLGVSDIEDAEVEGFITGVLGRGDVLIGNQHVTTSASTQFEGGTIDNLILDAHVEIHGRIANGILEAESITFDGMFEIESNVAALNAGARSLTLVGLTGMTLHVDSNTAIDGEGNLRRFEDITVGDHLKIHGRPSGNAGVLATELERSDPGSKVKLHGPVQSILGSVLTIAGSTIDTAAIQDNRFTRSDGTIIGRSGFFQALANDRKVTVIGTAAGSVVSWTSVRLSGGE